MNAFYEVFWRSAIVTGDRWKRSDKEVIFGEVVFFLKNFEKFNGVTLWQEAVLENYFLDPIS